LNVKVAALVYKTEITAVGICSADHATPLYPQKLALTSPTCGGCLVGIVCLRTKATELKGREGERKINRKLKINRIYKTFSKRDTLINCLNNLSVNVTLLIIGFE
jgi:hypothetical protein